MNKITKSIKSFRQKAISLLDNSAIRNDTTIIDTDSLDTVFTNEVQKVTSMSPDSYSVALANIITNTKQFYKPKLDALTQERKKLNDDTDTAKKLIAEQKKVAEKSAFVKKRSEELLLAKKINNRKYAEQIATNEFNRIHTRLEAEGIDLDKDLPVVKNNMDKKFVGYGVIVALTILEMPLTFDVLQKQSSLPVWMLYMVCFLVAFMFVFSAHFFTKGLVRKDKKAAYGALSIGVLALCFQVTARLFMADDSQYLLIILNISTFLTSIIAARWMNKYRDIFDAKDELGRYSAQIIEENVVIDNQQHDLDYINDVQYEGDLNKNDQNLSEQAEQQKRKTEERLNNIDQQESIIKQDEEKQIVRGQALVDEAYQRNERKNVNKLKVSTAVAIGLVLTVCSCSVPDSKVVFLGLDKSISEIHNAANNPKAISTHIINKEFQLNDEKHLNDKCVLNIGFIGNSERPQVITLELPAGNANPLMRINKDRKEVVNAYAERVHTVIDSMYTTIPANHQTTHFAMAQCSFLSRLASIDTSTEKVLILISDGRETGILNFSNYSDRNDFINNFEHITNQIDAYCSPGNLDGNVSIKLITSPNMPRAIISTQDIALFWQYYMTVHNGNFTVLSNL